jgi:hypothetical protein
MRTSHKAGSESVKHQDTLRASGRIAHRDTLDDCVAMPRGGCIRVTILSFQNVDDIACGLHGLISNSHSAQSSSDCAVVLNADLCQVYALPGLVVVGLLPPYAGDPGLDGCKRLMGDHSTRSIQLCANHKLGSILWSCEFCAFCAFC